MFESTTSHLNISNPLRRMASVVAGASLYELLPKAVLIGGGENEVGFYYDFILDDPPIPELATLVKEKMKNIFSKMPPFREMEMVAFSALQLFEKKNHLGALDLLEELNPKALVTVVQLGEFVDLAEGPFEAPAKTFLDHLEVKVLEEGVYRLQGCVDLNQDALKSHVKKIIRYAQENYLTEGVKLGWWYISQGEFVWLSKGLQAKRKLVSDLKEIICKEILEVSSVDEKAIFEWLYLKKKEAFFTYEEKPFPWKESEGFFGDDNQNFFTIQAVSRNFVSESLLPSIAQLHTIFSFRPSLFLSGRKKEESFLEKKIFDLGWTVEKLERKGSLSLVGYAEDGLGRRQKLWELQERKEGNCFQLKLGVERMLAFLVEMNLGK